MFNRKRADQAQEKLAELRQSLDDLLDESRAQADQTAQQAQSRVLRFGRAAKAQIDDVADATDKRATTLTKAARVRLEEMRGEIEDLLDEGRSQVEDATSRADSQVHQLGKNGAARLTAMRKQLDSLIEDGRGQIDDAIGGVSDRADGVARTAGARLEDAADVLRKSAPRKGPVGDAARNVARTIERSGKTLKKRGTPTPAEHLSSFFSDNPWLFVLGGVVVIALIVRRVLSDAR